MGPLIAEENRRGIFGDAIHRLKNKPLPSAHGIEFRQPGHDRAVIHSPKGDARGDKIHDFIMKTHHDNRMERHQVKRRQGAQVSSDLYKRNSLGKNYD